MDRNKVFEMVQTCASRTFEVDTEQISMQSSIDNTKGWDSLGHLKFIMEIESELGITFRTEEIPALVTIDIICDSIAEYKK